MDNALLRRFLLIDGHNDLPWALRQQHDGDTSKVDFSQPVSGDHTDLDRIAAGGLGAQFWSVFVPAELARRGWSESDCRALAGANLLRALRAAEAYAGSTVGPVH